MKKLLTDFINFIFSFQESYLEEKYKKKLNALNYSKDKMYKTHLSSGASLTFSSELEKNKQKVKSFVKRMAKENSDNPEKILEYAKERGAKFYLVKNADKLLKPIKEVAGLIFPKRGFSALYLNLLTTKKISFKTDLMFVFKEDKLSIYDVLYNFYKWYSYRLNLPGSDAEADKKMKDLDSIENADLDDFAYADIISLKQALDRDRSAMEFVLEFIKETEGAKNAYNTLKDNEGGAGV